ncbi:MAG: hypothetical protein J2P50_09445 [Hyphomicrobiaceae bacterium]|nr:hypothetical protein [Hyphomicrobiaceae bacterium]
MIGRLAVVMLAFAWLPDCKGEGVPGSFDKFLPPVPTATVGSKAWQDQIRERKQEEMCSETSDGKRYWLEGYLQLPHNIEIKDGKTRLELYAQIDGNGQGNGRSISSIEVTMPGDIEDLMASATGKKYLGRRTTAQIDAEALRIRTADGLATARDKIKLTVDVVGLPERNFPFESRQLAACAYRFVKAHKI